jgi:hypothetical protein
MIRLNLALCGVLTLAAAAQTAAPLPKAEAVLDRFIEVTGGRAAYEKRHTRVSHATVDIAAAGIHGKMTVYAQEPNRNRGVLEFPGVGVIDSGNIGDVVWENSAVMGPRVKSGVEKDEALRDAVFNGPIHWREMYTKVENTGIETVDGRAYYKLVLTPKAGKPITEYYDKETGLLSKAKVIRSSPMGEIPAEISASDYQTESGVLEPHTMTTKLASQEIRIHIESVEVNAEIPNGRFDPPAEIEALLKKQAVKEPPVAATPSPAPAGKFAIFLNSKPVATETWTVTKTDGKTQWLGSGSANLGGLKIEIEEFRVISDSSYQPLEAVAKATLGQLKMAVHATFADGKAKCEVDQGQGPKPKEDAVHADAIVINANLPLFPWHVLAERVQFKDDAPQAFHAYVIGQAEVPLTAVYKGKEAVEFAGGKTEQLHHVNAAATTPQGQPVTLDFWIDDARRIVKIAVPSMKAEAYREGYEPKPAPAPAPAPAK